VSRWSHGPSPSSRPSEECRCQTVRCCLDSGAFPGRLTHLPRWSR
jgi:hypothetical protein